MESKEVYNLDIKQVLETKQESDLVAMPYVSQQGSISSGQYESTKVEGIDRPIIMINNYPLFPQNLDYMNITTDGFLPKISLSINDPQKKIQNKGLKDVDNKIVVVMLAPINDMVRKIKLTFFQLSCNTFGETIVFNGVMRLLPLEQPCRTKCGTMSTYDFLYNICNELGIGFSCTDQCEEVDDSVARFYTLNQSYKDVIQQHVGFGGNDQDSVFDCWVDVFGNLNLVNISYIMQSPSIVDKMEQNIVTGIKTNVSEMTTQFGTKAPRMITNYDGMGVNNILIDSYENKINNKKNYDEGTNVVFQNFNMKGDDVASDNDVATEGVQTNPNDDTTFTKNVYTGEHLNESRNTNNQQLQRDKTLQKLQTNMLKVEMRTANHYLIKGMLVMVLLVDNKLENKNAIHSDDDEMTTNEERRNIVEENKPVVLGLSGVYYIHSITYTYDIQQNKINQSLFLIKKELRSNE